MLFEKSISKLINFLIKRKFYSFGKNSCIMFPYLFIQNQKYISIGDNVTILRNSRLQVYNVESVADINSAPSIIIGNNCYFGFNFTILSDLSSKVYIHDNVLIASYVLICNENHGHNPEMDVHYMNQPLISSDVVIGEGSWIGEKSIILPGVTIGKKCVIGAASVVNKSIPDYCIAVGNPVRIIKKYNFLIHKWERFDEQK